MNNIQFWIWLIVIVITLIARARRKKQPVDADSSEMPSRPQHRVEESSKQMTFEELLREIESSKTPLPKPIPAKTYDRVDYDDNIEEEAKSLENTNYQYPRPQQTLDIYEKAKQQAFFRPSLEETLKLDDTIVRFGQFKGYQHGERVSPAAEFAREVRNPSGFKKAFIMSEILKRRF